jgi:hypothetical protein
LNAGLLQAQAAALRKVAAAEPPPPPPPPAGGEGGLGEMLKRGLSDRFAKLASMRRDHTVEAPPAADSTFG